MEKGPLKNEVKMSYATEIKPVNWVEAKREEMIFYMADDVKGAVANAVDEANKLENLENRGYALEIIQSCFPDIYQELKQGYK